MTNSTPQATANGARLVRLLAELGMSDARLSHQGFADRLGQLIDLSDSIDLASTHLKLSALPFERTSLSEDAIRKDFFDVRAAMLGAISRSFSPGGNPGKLRLPELDVEGIEALDYKPYLRYYGAMQRDMEFRVRNLQDRVRIALRGLSARLARLVSIEEALDQTLLHQHRKSFSVLPVLLKKRFDQHKEEQAEALVSLYQRDMRALLLAEADARLLPVLGLIEAMDEETETPNTRH